MVQTRTVPCVTSKSLTCFAADIVEKLGCETVLKLGWEPRLRRGEEGRERTGGKKGGGAGLGIAASKAQHRKSEASVWVLLDWWDPFIPHFLPVCFLLSVCSSCFDLPHSPSSRLNILQELPWDGKKCRENEV